MKANYKNRIKSIEESRRENTANIVKHIWEMTAALVLHNEFGYGETRLKKFFDELHATQTRFDEASQSTDPYTKSKEEMTNIDTVLFQMIRDLRKMGIDHRKIIDDGIEIVITEKDGSQRNIDDFIDRLDDAGRLY